MNSLKKQSGVATILMVILLGITVMVVTAAVAKNINGKKEATVAAHAQTNAQMMAWSGVSAFEQILIAQGATGVTAINALNGTSIPLKTTSTQNIVANNITVTGACTNNGDVCNVGADISANDIAAQAATTIHTNFTMQVANGTVQATPQNGTFTMGGNTTLTGNVAINAAVPNSTATLNVDGNLNIPAQGLITTNISTLNINSTGDVYIDCSITKCGGATINITAHNVTVSDGTNFGTIQASGNVIVGNGVKTTAQNITALGTVNVDTGSTVGNVISQGNVTMTGGSTATSVATQGAVSLLLASTVNGNVESYSTVKVSASTIKGNVNATGNVSMDTIGTVTGNVTTGGTTSLISSSTIGGNLNSQGAVTVSASTISGNVTTNSTVSMDTGGTITKNVVAGGAVSLSTSTVGGNIDSQSTVTVSTSSVGGTITSVGNVNLNAISTVNGNIGTQGNVVISASKVVGNVSAYNYIDLTATSTIQENVYAKSGNTIYATLLYGNVNVWTELGSSIKGTTYIATNGSAGGAGSYSSTKNNSQVSFTITPTATAGTITPTFTVLSGTALSSLGSTITTATTFSNHVDVKAYIGDANYIFLKANTSVIGSTQNFSVNKVYLNQVKNDSTATYVADCTTSATTATTCVQSVINSAGTKTQVGDGTGFALGNYTLAGQTYTGAICSTVNSSNQCTSSIIGYLPRLSITTTLGLNDAYAYATNVWYVRSAVNPSTLNNATLAPGIMYFDGSLNITGYDNSVDSTGSAYVNSFLAEGSIDATANSPTIYSPYNVVQGKGTAGLVCNRPLMTTNGTTLASIGNTSPATSFTTYLKPVNLCKDNATFAYSMNKNTDGSQKTVTIDGTSVPKMDLGNTALMANGDVTVLLCGRIYGDILARGHVHTSGTCGINAVPNGITGQITSQGDESAALTSTILNKLEGGTTFNLPAASSGASTAVNGLLIDSSTFKLLWTKML